MKCLLLALLLSDKNREGIIILLVVFIIRVRFADDKVYVIVPNKHVVKAGRVVILFVLIEQYLLFMPSSLQTIFYLWLIFN